MPKRHVVAVHHADRRRDVMMPYAPALVVRRGALVFLSGVTAAPVYHSHPHREEEFDLPTDMRSQATLAMDNLVKTLEAAGCGLGDLVSATRYLTDVREQDDLNRVWASYLGDHLPTTTTVEVSRLATHANCKIEIAAIAVTEPAAEPPRATSGSRRGAPAPAKKRAAPAKTSTPRSRAAAPARATKKSARTTRRRRT